jgi:hypothetical protein
VIKQLYSGTHGEFHLGDKNIAFFLKKNKKQQQETGKQEREKQRNPRRLPAPLFRPIMPL